MNHLLQKLPRWTVLQIDMFVCTVAAFLAFFLRYNFDVPANAWRIIYLTIPQLLMIKLFSFLWAKSYSGIIRYTSLEDAKRILKALSAALFVSLMLNMFYYTVVKDMYFPLSVLIIDYFASILFMGAFRIMAKIAYYEWQHQNQRRINVIIYGAGEAGIITKRTLDRDTGTNYKVVAFVDDSRNKYKSTLEGVQIFHARKDLARLIHQRKVEMVIISIQKISPERKKRIVDLCLSYGVTVRNVPPVERWINGELSFKQIKDVNIEDVLGRDSIKLDKTAIGEELHGKVVLITGAAGSIGSEIVHQVINFLPKKVVLLDQAESPLNDLDLRVREHHPKLNVETCLADIVNEKRMELLFASLRPDIVFHAAAYKHVPVMEENPTEAINTNVKGTKLLADLSVKYQVKKFVMISTDKAVNPSNVMGASKRIAEIYTQSLFNTITQNQQNGTKFITTRFGNVLGSNGSVIPRFRKQIAEGGPVTVTHPEITRYFMTIPEACQLVLEAGAMGKGGEIFLFDMGKSIKIVDLAKKMIKLSGLTLGKDIQLVFTGLRPGEKLYEELLSDKENTLPTHHPKIMIAKVLENDFNEVSKKVTDLVNSLQAEPDEAVVEKMKKIVPEFKSQNSVYSKLDMKEEAFNPQ